MTLQWLTGWWNLIFIVPFFLALMYLFLCTLGGLDLGEAEADVDVDHDVDLHLDADAHLEMDHDLDHGVESDTNADHDADQSSAMLSALNWIGVGQMPLSLLLMILMLCWGAIGFAAMQVQHGREIGASFAISAVSSAATGLLITHFISSILGPRLFKPANTVRRWHQLLGSRGEAMFPIDEQFGMVCGRDERGERYQAACRIADGYAPLAKGSTVQLVAYAAKNRMFYVVPADSGITPRQVAR